MVYMLLGTGFEETEAIAPLDIMRRAGIPVLTVGINGKTVVSSHKVPVVADITLEEMDLTDMDMIVLPAVWEASPPSGEASRLWMPLLLPGTTISGWLPSAPVLRCWQTCTSPTDGRLPAIPAVKPAWGKR